MINKNLILYTNDKNLENQIAKMLGEYDINMVTCSRWIHALLEILDQEFSVAIIDDDLRLKEKSDLVTLIRKYSPKTFIVLLTSGSNDPGEKNNLNISRLTIQRPISDLKLTVMARTICDRIYGTEGLGN